jgi:hypothetical protein
MVKKSTRPMILSRKTSMYSDTWELQMGWPDGSRMLVLKTTDQLRTFDLETRFEEQGYNMKLIEEFGELRYQEGRDDGFASF